MVPTAYQTFTTTLLDELGAGRVTQARVDDAVARILTQKFKPGLFEQPYADRTNLGTVGSPAHRAVGRADAAKSQVLLKNDDVLPLATTSKVYVAGSNADDLGNQMGGWSISWQGASGRTTTGTTILEGIRQVVPDATFSQDASAPVDGHDVGVVVVGELPYAEGIGDVGNGHDLLLTDADKAAVTKVCAAMKCAVLVVSGRPQLIGDQLGEIERWWQSLSSACCFGTTAVSATATPTSSSHRPIARQGWVALHRAVRREVPTWTPPAPTDLHFTAQAWSGSRRISGVARPSGGGARPTPPAFCSGGGAACGRPRSRLSGRPTRRSHRGR